nr:site-specific integrase [Corynebacterium sp. LK15]
MWRDRLLDDFSEGSAKDVVGILGNLLEYAREAGAIDSNPARGLRWRGRGSRAKQQNILTPSQIASFTEELQRSRYDDKVGYSSLVLFLVGTGCRYGEATALTVGDVDLATGTAVIRRTVTRSETGRVTVGSTTKTGETRTVSMPPQVVEALRPRVADRHPTELVWHALRGDVYTPLPMPATSHSWWSEAVARCVAEDDTFPKGLGRHDLRHTAASLLISAGANVLQVQRQLGHAKPSITLDTYSHLFDSGLGAIGAKMGEILNSGCSEVVVESHPEK